MIVEIRSSDLEKNEKILCILQQMVGLADMTDIEGWNKTIVINTGTGETQLLHTHSKHYVYRAVNCRGVDVWYRYPDTSSLTLIGSPESIFYMLGGLFSVLNVDTKRVTNIFDLLKAEIKENTSGLSQISGYQLLLDERIQKGAFDFANLTL